MWNEGQGAQAVGEATPMAAANALGMERATGRGGLEVPATKQAIARTLRTPEGKLRPIVSAGSRIVGAGLGAATGLPEGGLIGALTGRSIADALIPKRGFELTPQIYDTARNQMYNEMGSRLMRRPDIATPEPKPPQPFAGTAVSTSPPGIPRGGPTPLREFAARQARQPVSATTLPKSLPGVSVVPEPRAPFEGENPKYMASITRSRLQQLASQGKLGAGTQLQQLGKPLIYVPPEGYPGPRAAQPLSPEEIDEALRRPYRNATD
jgi:hypothetical protein